MKNSTDVETMYWWSVHGVVVMKKYMADKPITLTKNRSNESRPNQDGSDSVPSKKELADILLS
ncbi:MAG: hypothetical protein IIB46_07425 [Nitrospinae bacterium]|nr:hypothetical protein [Nitrospinota bacterium]